MDFIKIGLLSTLVTLGWCDFHHDMIYDSYASHSFRHPWYLHDYHRPESSEIVPHFISSPFYYETAASSLQPSGFKRTPNEQKHLKKPYPEVFKASPRCQEISAKESTAHPTVDPRKSQRVTCYKCKDPINGSIFEQCSYSSEKPQDSLSSASNPVKKKKKNYRFPEDYFHQGQPSAEESIEKEASNGCERVVRNSMVCMVCRDPKTNGKYEQCSYVANPNEKAFGYSKSSSFGNPNKHPKAQEQTAPKAQKVKAPAESQQQEEEEPLEEAEETEESDPDSEHVYFDEPEDYGHEESGSSEDKEGHYTYHYPSFHDTYGGSYESDDSKQNQDAKSSDGNCKTVHRDGQSCKVCTNPKTGGESERCDYAHEPKDKVYKYSKSKSFGYPESNSGGGDESSAASSSSSAQDEDYEPTNVEVAKQKGCRKVKRDSMICTICKDPKTGEDSEQCNYSYDPEDKVFAYTKSNSFGSPYSGPYEEPPEESASVIYPTGTSPLDYIPKTSESRVHTTREQKPKVEDE